MLSLVNYRNAVDDGVSLLEVGKVAFAGRGRPTVVEPVDEPQLNLNNFI